MTEDRENDWHANYYQLQPLMKHNHDLNREFQYFSILADIR